MSSSNPPPKESAASHYAVPPLTHCTTKGKAYTRHVDVEEEIVRLLSEARSTWVANGLKSETIVHLLRRLRAECDLETFGKLFEHLDKRIVRIVEDNAKGFDSVTTEEIAIKVGERIIQRILADPPTRSTEFLEIAFRQAVKRVTLNEVESRSNDPKLHQFADPDGTDDGSGDYTAGTISSVKDEELSPQEGLVEAERLEMQPELIRKALGSADQ
jgi:hypothetical protein